MILCWKLSYGRKHHALIWGFMKCMIFIMFNNISGYWRLARGIKGSSCHCWNWWSFYPFYSVLFVLTVAPFLYGLLPQLPIMFQCSLLQLDFSAQLVCIQRDVKWDIMLKLLHSGKPFASVYNSWDFLLSIRSLMTVVIQRNILRPFCLWLKLELRKAKYALFS